MKKLKLPKFKAPFDQIEFMVLVSLGLIGAGMNEMFGRGSAMLCCGCLVLMLSMIVARGQVSEGSQ